MSPRDGVEVLSQWDRSVLRLVWRFWDPDSTVVSHSIDIRSKVTGRLVTDTIHLAADTEVRDVGICISVILNVFVVWCRRMHFRSSHCRFILVLLHVFYRLHHKRLHPCLLPMVFLFLLLSSFDLRG